MRSWLGLAWLAIGKEGQSILTTMLARRKQSPLVSASGAAAWPLKRLKVNRGQSEEAGKLILITGVTSSSFSP